MGLPILLSPVAPDRRTVWDLSTPTRLSSGQNQPRIFKLNGDQVVNGTQLENLPDEFPRHYPTTADAKQFVNQSTQRLAFGDASSGATGRWYQWALVGRAYQQDWWYKFTYQGSSSGGTVARLIFCWEPDADRSSRGDCYVFTQHDAGSRLSYFELDSATENTIASSTLGGNKTYFELVIEVHFTHSTRSIDCYSYRVIDPRPTTPTLTSSDTSYDGGFFGFQLEGTSNMNGIGVGNLYLSRATHAWW
jgi:hypothetical protein